MTLEDRLVPHGCPQGNGSQVDREQIRNRRETSWTVVGYYEDTWQAFCTHVEAVDAYAAMGLVGKQSEAADSLLLVGAIQGKHDLWTPGEDNGSVASASEMVEHA